MSDKASADGTAGNAVVYISAIFWQQLQLFVSITSLCYIITQTPVIVNTKTDVTVIYNSIFIRAQAAYFPSSPKTNPLLSAEQISPPITRLRYTRIFAYTVPSYPW